MTRGTHCHGDFCALAPQLVKATQDRQRQNQREEEERRSLEAKQAEEARRKTEEAAAANKGGKGYINFSMLAAVAMKEKAKETSSASQLNETVSVLRYLWNIRVNTDFLGCGHDKVRAEPISF